MTNKNMGEQVPEICVILKEPGKEPRMEKIPNTLEALQEAVGGLIEMVPGSWGFQVISNKEGPIVRVPPIWVICNEEGLFLELPHCCTIGKVDIVGPILLVGVREEGLADVPITLEAARGFFPGLWETRGEGRGGQSSVGFAASSFTKEPDRCGGDERRRMTND